MGMEVQKRPLEILPEPIDNSPVDKGTATDSKKETKNIRVSELIIQNVDLIYEKATEFIYIKDKGLELYRKLDDDELSTIVWKTWYSTYGSFLPKDIEAVIKTIKMIIPNRVEQVSKRFIMVSKNWFWDRDTGMITQSPTEPVFYRLFDTVHETKHIVKIPEFTTEHEKLMLDTYNQVLEEISQGIETERFEPLKVWANGSHDIYMDLHRAHAYCFLAKLPVGVYLLIGGAAGGKSSYAGMTHSIFGEQNTSGVTLADMNDWHANHDLGYTLMNCPDEDEDKVLSAQAIFKTVADHGLVRLNTMASHQRLEVDCDFMCFFPMNHTPKWEGSGAQACMRRTLAIPFNNDLSKFDKTTEDFAHNTFTAEFMAEYIGSVFAYANYYHRHELAFSDTMMSYQQALAEEASSYQLYIPRFLRYFDGYTSRKIVYQDYINWCMAREIKIAKRDDFLFHLDIKIPKKPAGTKIIDGKRQRYYQNEKPNHYLFSELFSPADAKEIRRVEDLHELGISMVEQLDMFYESKGVKFNEPS